MELEQLRHFLKVAELASFTRAAEQLGMSQPALSRSVARLEEELGRPLFERQTRRIVLTDSGGLLVDRARKMLALADDTKAEIRDDADAGRIRVAAIPTVAPYFLPASLQRFQKEFPRVQVIVQEDTTDQLLKKVADGDVELAIAAQPILAKHLEVEPLFEEELLLVTGRNHPLARKKVIRPEDMEGYPFVLLGEAHCLADNVMSYCRQQAFHPVSVERTSQLAMVQELVALGHGISLVPAMARCRDSSPNRVYRSLAGRRPTRTIVMISNPYRYHSRLIRRFAQHLKQTDRAES